MTTYKEIELRQIFKESSTITIDVQISEDKCEQHVCTSFDEAKNLIERYESTTNVYF